MLVVTSSSSSSSTSAAVATTMSATVGTALSATVATSATVGKGLGGAGGAWVAGTIGFEVGVLTELVFWAPTMNPAAKKMIHGTIIMKKFTLAAPATAKAPVNHKRHN